MDLLFINAISCAGNKHYRMKMKQKCLAATITIVLLTLPFLSIHCFADGYVFSYQLLNHPDGSTYYNLNVAVSESLYEYYLGKNHGMSSNNDFAKFVTPYALKPISDSLEEVYSDDEDFVNGVLMIVHQIPYEVTVPTKYPVETICLNKGDCDLFSLIAASIIKARGLDVVLLYYEGESHMNIGVNLSHVPNDAREQPHYVTHDNVHYYMAECTGGDWQNGWRIGECPTSLENAPVQVVTLENCEQTTLGQVSASYHTLSPSTISISIEQSFLIQGSTITLSGKLTPALQNRIVTVYVRINVSPWTAVGSTMTDSNGDFGYAWSAETSGIYEVRVGWSGDDNYAGADSQIQTLTVLSMFFILILGMTTVLGCVGLAVFLMSKRAKPSMPEPQPPEIPS